MDFEGFEKSPGFLVRCADMLRNHGFAWILKNGRIFGTLCGLVRKCHKIGVIAVFRKVSKFL